MFSKVTQRRWFFNTPLTTKIPVAYRFEIAGYKHHVNATGTDLVQHEEQVRH